MKFEALLPLSLLAVSCLFSSEPATKKAVAPAIYPPLARIAGLEAVVEVDVTVGPDGKVLSVKNSRTQSGYRQLAPVSEMYAKKWEFSEGSNLPITITFEFRLLPYGSKVSATEYGTEFIPPRRVVFTAISGKEPPSDIP